MGGTQCDARGVEREFVRDGPRLDGRRFSEETRQRTKARSSPVQLCVSPPLNPSVLRINEGVLFAPRGLPVLRPNRALDGLSRQTLSGGKYYFVIRIRGGDEGTAGQRVESGYFLVYGLAPLGSRTSVTYVTTFLSSRRLARVRIHAHECPEESIQRRKKKKNPRQPCQLPRPRSIIPRLLYAIFTFFFLPLLPPYYATTALSLQ